LFAGASWTGTAQPNDDKVVHPRLPSGLSPLEQPQGARIEIGLAEARGLAPMLVA
jgi:hypothetical protein